MDAAPDETPLIGVDDDMKELLGLYDVPAFARRGQDLEYALARIDQRCRRDREAMLEMVRVRVRQWTAVASGPSTALVVFEAPLDDLLDALGAPPPAWAPRDAPPRKLRAAGRDLVASVARFNLRWSRLLAGTNFEAINRLIDRYNRYYMLEKECSLGSARLAARFFAPKPSLTLASLLERHPGLPLPVLRP